MRASAPASDASGCAAARGNGATVSAHNGGDQTFAELLTGRAAAAGSTSTTSSRSTMSLPPAKSPPGASVLPPKTSTTNPTPAENTPANDAPANHAPTNDAPASDTTSAAEFTPPADAVAAADTRQAGAGKMNVGASDAASATAPVTASKRGLPASAAAAATRLPTGSPVTLSIVAPLAVDASDDTRSTPPDATTTSPDPKRVQHRDPSTDESATAGQLAAQAALLLGAAAIPLTAAAGSAPQSRDAGDADDTGATTVRAASGPAAVVGAASADARGPTPAATGAATAAATQAAVISDAAAADKAADAANAESNPNLTALSNLMHAVPAASPQIDAPQRSIPTPVFDAAWPHALSAQVRLMASSNVQSATLRLSPEHLGPVEVHIDLQSTQINVNFVAAHPDTRSALEQSVPTLRAMFAQGGLTLGQTHVQGEARSGSQSQSAAARNGVDRSAGDAPIEVISVTRNLGLVDEYA